MKRLFVFSAALALSPGAWALGIRLFDHDAFATARGDAFVATADNASAMYYNPAGITQLQGHNVRGSLNTLFVDADFDPKTGRSVSTKDELKFLPNLFYTWTPNDSKFSFGAAYYVPFGLSLEWPDNGPFRAVTTHGELVYHTLAGVAAWKVCPTLSIAAGPTLNYATCDLRRGIFSAGDEFRFRGDDWDLGAVAGILWQPLPRHSFGVSYRSQTTMKLEGRSATTPQLLPRQHAEAEMPFPTVLIGGYSFRPTTNWNLEINLDYTDWERVNTVTLRQRAGGNVALPLNWNSSFGVEAGATHYFDNGLHVSGGYVYLQDSTPTRTFDPLVPDQDMHVFSLGIGGAHSSLTWDVTYQFTWGVGRDVSGSVYGPSVSGHYDFIAHAVAVSVGWRF